MAIINIASNYVPTECYCCRFQNEFYRCLMGEDIYIKVEDIDNCPIKSIDGLIELLKEQKDGSIEVNKERNSDILKGYKIGMDIAIMFIKEYCGME